MTNQKPIYLRVPKMVLNNTLTEFKPTGDFAEVRVTSNDGKLFLSFPRAEKGHKAIVDMLGAEGLFLDSSEPIAGMAESYILSGKQDIDSGKIESFREDVGAVERLLRGIAKKQDSVFKQNRDAERVQHRRQYDAEHPTPPFKQQVLKGIGEWIHKNHPEWDAAFTNLTGLTVEDKASQKFRE